MERGELLGDGLLDEPAAGLAAQQQGQAGFEIVGEEHGSGGTAHRAGGHGYFLSGIMARPAPARIRPRQGPHIPSCSAFRGVRPPSAECGRSRL